MSVIERGRTTPSQITIGFLADDPHAHLVAPNDIATQKLAYLGISGSGKTYGASRTVEVLHAHGDRFAVIDTVGNWGRGLRLAADGKSAGIRVPVVGGDHGDVELDPAHGKLVAQTLAGSDTSMVIDISDMTDGERRKFLVDFAAELLVQKKKHPGPLMIVWEECHEVIPQKVFGEDARMVGAVQRLIKRGRNYGIGTMLISQRPAAVNKECLWQCHTMFCFRVIGTHDRKQIEDWMSDHGTEKNTVAFSKLETGTCMVWSPDWLKIHTLVRIAPKWTFDASSTPDAQPQSLAKLSPINLEDFKKRMAEAVIKAQESSPDFLKAKIAQLEKELAGRDTGAMKPADKELLDRLTKERRVLTNEITRLRNVFVRISSELDRTDGIVTGLTSSMRAKIATEALAEEHDVVARLEATPLTVVTAPAMTHTPQRDVRPAKHDVPKGPGRADMSKMMRTFLTVLAQQARAMPKGKILAYADYAASGSTAACFAEMQRAGYVLATHGSYEITQDGRRALGAYTPLPTGDALYQQIQHHLPTMERAILRVVRDAYPAAIGKSEILKQAKYAASGSTAKAFAWLIQRDYITKEGGGAVRASSHLID